MENAINAGVDLFLNRLKSVPLQVAVVLIGISLPTQVGLISYFKDITVLQASALSLIISALFCFAAHSIEVFNGNLSVANSDWRQSLALGIIVAAIGGPIFLVKEIIYYHDHRVEPNPFIYLLKNIITYLFWATIIIFFVSISRAIYKQNRNKKQTQVEQTNEKA